LLNALRVDSLADHKTIADAGWAYRTNDRRVGDLPRAADWALVHPGGRHTETRVIIRRPRRASPAERSKVTQGRDVTLGRDCRVMNLLMLTQSRVGVSPFHEHVSERVRHGLNRGRMARVNSS